MASKAAVATVLAYLHELYPSRDVSSVTADAWALTFAAWSDEDLTRAAQQAAATPGRTFFPTPGEIAECRPTTTPVVDAPKILRQIEKLSAYTPQAGTIAPHVQQVRDALGNAVADAYAAAGAQRCFADDATARSIAAHTFQKTLEGYVTAPPLSRPLLDSGESVRRFQGEKHTGTESVAVIVTRALPKGTAA
jgi:hypothetical protein